MSLGKEVGKEFKDVIRNFFLTKYTSTFEHTPFQRYLMVIGFGVVCISFMVAGYLFASINISCLCEQSSFASYIKAHANTECDQFAKNCYIEQSAIDLLGEGESDIEPIRFGGSEARNGIR